MMDIEELYNIDNAKKQLQYFLDNTLEPELVIKIKGLEYMIIPLSEQISFQWIGESDEFYYNSVEELFNSELLNGIVLNRDWNTIEDIYYFE